MELIAYQEVGGGYDVTVRRKATRDSEGIVESMNDNHDIEVEGELTFGYYVGGEERGYDVRIKLTKRDLLEMLAQVTDLERREHEQIVRCTVELRRYRKQRIQEEIKHEEALAKRRARDRKRRMEQQKQGKHGRRLLVVS